MGEDPAGAAAALEALAERSPGGDWAADALLEAAQLAEERLGRPDHALALYERLLGRYPSSRLALRAWARRDFLRGSLATGVGPLAEYQEILNGYARRPRAESIARMERLLAAHPDFARADRATLWLAEAAAQDERWDEADRRYLEVMRRWPGKPAAAEAAEGHATALLGRGDVLAARRAWAALAASPDPTVAAAGARGLDLTRRALGRLALFFAALAYVVGYIALQAWRAGRALGRAPLELRFFVPVAVVFVLASLGAQREATAALAITAVGGALVIWTGAAALRRRLTEAGRVRRLVHGLGAALAVAAVFYCALHTAALTDFVVETLRAGPERG